ncbi:MAG: NADH-quinone oxidoreductase subunit NuoH [Myxococcales bacterium]|nr:NADH-quinone oxidoreductase subunit NuoH [Myxococcales bacterium]
MSGTSPIAGVSPLVYTAFALLGALAVVLGVVPMLVWMERKVAARFQRRVGPNRVGPLGLLQSVADAVKLIFKEDFFPRNTDKAIFLLAPILTFMPGLVSFALVPVAAMPSGQALAGTSINMGLLVMLAISSLTAYGIAFAGWSSNNQYSLLGGIRSSAQLISYEVIMGLSVVALLLKTGSLDLAEIVRQQEGRVFFGLLPNWNGLTWPPNFLLFLLAAFAETNRAPFDNPEAEQELVGGYHTEYTGLRYAWFMFGEYAGLWTMCSLMTVLFLGGWYLPGLNRLGLDTWTYAVVAFLIFTAKVMVLVFGFMWVRWTLPRMRWDQLMALGWKRLIPIALLNLILLALAMEYGGLFRS